MSEQNSGLMLSVDGFLYYRGAKLPFKLREDGFEFFEKDPRRAAALGGQRYVVPFETLLDFINQIISNNLS